MELEKGKTMSQRNLPLNACIILKTVENQEWSGGRSVRSPCPFKRERSPAKRVRSREEEQGSERSFSARAGGCRRKRRERTLLRRGQAGKSARGMPWHQEPTKVVTSCDKPRGAAHTHRSVDDRMGKPGGAILRQPALNQIGVGGEPPELKHLSRARKRHQQRFRK